MRLAKLVLTVGLLVIGTTVLGAGPQDQGSVDREDQAIKNPKQLLFEANSTYQVFDHAIDLWHDAILKGDDKRANFYLDEICDIITEDIQTNKLQMKMLVRQIEACYQENSFEGKNLFESNHEDKEITKYKEYLPVLSSMILIKEELYRAMSRTEAFSNDYRLLGDYKNLLRRELGMPKLKMADIPTEKPKQASTTK